MLGITEASRSATMASMTKQTSPRECPCGQAHAVSPNVEAQIRQNGPTLPVLTQHGAWYVPRVYAVAHGIQSAPLREAAEQYGFTPVTAS